MKRAVKNKTGYELAVLVAVIFIFLLGSFPAQKNATVSFLESGVSLSVEIADTPYMQGKGLMFRQKMFLDSGMLFVFQQPQELKFWMKNTLMPLDMIFISENLKIVNIVEDAKPCANSCEIYSSILPVKYTVETNAGFAERNGIKAGNRVSIG